MKLFDTFKRIRWIKSEIKTLARAYTDARTPLWTKLAIAGAGLLYILSPIDILPEILPLLGISDDLLILPVLMWTFIPNDILDDARAFVEKNKHHNEKRFQWILWSIALILVTILGYIYYLLVT